MTRDPVCGMNVDEQQAAAKAEYQGTTYYFCSAGCHKAFAAEPQKFQRGTSGRPTAGPKQGR